MGKINVFDKKDYSVKRTFHFSKKKENIYFQRTDLKNIYCRFYRCLITKVLSAHHKKTKCFAYVSSPSNFNMIGLYRFFRKKQ